MDWAIGSDPDSGIISVSVRGEWDMAAGLEALWAIWREQATTGLRLVLWDLEHVSAAPFDTSELRDFANHSLRGRPDLPEAKAALVVTSDALFGTARMLEAFLTGGPVVVEVFRSQEEALAWLKAEDSQDS